MLLQELSEAIGVSGQEDAVRKIILKAIQDHATDIQIDSIGNVTAVLKAKGKNKHAMGVMLDAHMDEVGFMVTGVDGDGLIRFTGMGGLDDRILPGLRVKVGDKQTQGVIIWAPIHKTHGQNNTFEMSRLRIDIGAGSRDEANGSASQGDRVAFDSRFMEIGAKTLRGKSFDDRVGCSLLIDVLQNGPYPVDVLAAFTVQEEIGLRGAKVAAQRLKPDVAFALEGTPAHDVPDPNADPDDMSSTPNPACKLGGGPVLTVMDRSMITDPRILNFLRKTAEDAKIPYQLKTMLGGGTDAGSIHTSNSGIPSGVISVPCRYIHSPTSYLNRDDYDNTLKLVQAALRSISPDTLAR